VNAKALDMSIYVEVGNSKIHLAASLVKICNEMPMGKYIDVLPARNPTKPN
jgi:hypothetical protein